MDGTELDVADAVLAEDLDLLDGVLRDLVGKGTEADHWDVSPVGTCSVIRSVVVLRGGSGFEEVPQSYQPTRKPPASGGQSSPIGLRYPDRGGEKRRSRRAL